VQNLKIGTYLCGSGSPGSSSGTERDAASYGSKIPKVKLVIYNMTKKFFIYENFFMIRMESAEMVIIS
jgi:hypothetical protein